MLGLFLLGYITRKTKGIHELIGTIIGVVLIAWMTLSNQTLFHNYLTIVFGTITIFLVGFLLSFIFKGNTKSRAK